MRSTLSGFAFFFIFVSLFSVPATNAQQGPINDLLVTQADIPTEQTEVVLSDEASENEAGEETASDPNQLSASAEWVRAVFPIWLHDTHFLLADYQWICCFFLVLLGVFADVCIRTALRWTCRVVFKQRPPEELPEAEQQERKRLWKPIGLLAQAGVWYWGTSLIGLPEAILVILLVGLKFYTVVAAVWTSFRFVDIVTRFLQRKAQGTDTKFDDLLIPLFRKGLKIFAVCVGMILFADIFSLDVTALVGGLGIGTAALAFASQDMLSNVFGSVTVLADRPFEIGDWIVTDGVEGTVESVGMRSTRVRTFYNSVLTLPNSRLTTAVVDNMGRRRFRRVRMTIGLQYDSTPDQIDAFCEGARELLLRHPYTRKDYYQVYFNDFSSSSLDVLLYAFFDCPDWSVELRERHRLLLDIMRLASAIGVQFAFPTQTLHMFNEENNIDYSSHEHEQPKDYGRQLAADIAGPLLIGEDRPGPVVFPGAAEMGDGDEDGGEG